LVNKEFLLHEKAAKTLFSLVTKSNLYLGFSVANDSQRFGLTCPGAQKTSLTLLTGTGELGPWEKYTGVTVTNKVEEKQYS